MMSPIVHMTCQTTELGIVPLNMTSQMTLVRTELLLTNFNIMKTKRRLTLTLTQVYMRENLSMDQIPEVTKISTRLALIKRIKMQKLQK